jgi:hypothetical protein
MLRRISNLKAATSLNGLQLSVHPETIPNLFYEGAWTESWCRRRCQHRHRTVAEAAECAVLEGPAWYVFAVQDGKPRQLTNTEERSLQELRRARWPLKQARGAS